MTKRVAWPWGAFRRSLPDEGTRAGAPPRPEPAHAPASPPASPPAGPLAALRPALDVDPRPLLLSRKKIVVAWAPKSACSHVVIWFFLKEGLLGAANYYHPWPHNFRAQVYYGSQTYKRLAAELAAGLASPGGSEHTLLKVVRDPTKRLVSIFRHVCRHPILRRDLDRKLGLDTDRDGLSLREFDAYLAEESLVVPSRLNMHVCAQHHPLWTRPFARVVTINMDETDLNRALNAFEADAGLAPTDFAKVPKFAALGARHYAQEARYEGPGAIEDHRFRAADTDAFPKAAFEASPFVRAMAERRYGVDFAATRSGDTAGRLAFPGRGGPSPTAAPGGRPPVAAL
jgi:hypothetical protein